MHVSVDISDAPNKLTSYKDFLFPKIDYIRIILEIFIN